MKSSPLVLATFGLAALASSPSFAAPVTYDVSVDVNAAVVVPATGNNIALNLYPVATYSGFPIALNDGDTIDFHVTAASGITINSAGPGLTEFLGIASLETDSGYVPPGGVATSSSPTVLTYDSSTTLTVSSATGDLANASLTNSVTDSATPTTNFNALVSGDITDSTVTLYDFDVATTITNIDYQPGYENLAAFNTISGSGAIFLTGEPVATPAPGALALLCLGLIGIGGLHRRRQRFARAI